MAELSEKIQLELRTTEWKRGTYERKADLPQLESPSRRMLTVGGSSINWLPSLYW